MIDGYSFYVNGEKVVTNRQSALTTALTALSSVPVPSSYDYALNSGTTNSTPYGFVSEDELRTVLQVIANTQTRLTELETRLKTHGLIA